MDHWNWQFEPRRVRWDTCICINSCAVIALGVTETIQSIWKWGMQCMTKAQVWPSSSCRANFHLVCLICGWILMFVLSLFTTFNKAAIMYENTFEADHYFILKQKIKINIYIFYQPGHFTILNNSKYYVYHIKKLNTIIFRHLSSQ